MNEAAERLHNYFLNLGVKDGMSDAYSLDLDAALAAARSEGYEYGLLHNESPEIAAVASASRRATVRRIRERLASNHNLLGAEFYRLDQIEAILDEEAAR